ncbi:3-keto-5-aminohexanoate cleavage protein [Acidocella sp.]|uniref:3-keto-5-aminohexanoate cleavage protein n=1 Tax=Acidocella sp. TaxID=50710 RepID=UPI003CFFDFD0
MKQKSVIVTCAITGSLHTPSMSPHLPITPDEIVMESVAAAQAGASIIHLHARDPQDGRPTANPDVFMQFLPRIKQQTNAVLNLTTGGAPGMSVDERLAAPERASPEMTSLNMGSINNGLFAGSRRIKNYKYDWERPFLESGKRGMFENSFASIEAIMKRMGQEHGARFEFECYDLGHIYNLAYMMDQKLYDGPLFLQFILGILGGVGGEIDHLLHMVRTAQRLFGSDVEWSVLAAGRYQIPMCTHNALLGGNVRVGLEDSLSIGPGQLASSNAEQVLKIRRILEELHFTIATPDEVRERLCLKGAHNVNF